MNNLEIDFLVAIDWSLLVSVDEFDKMTLKIETTIALEQFKERGWASYSDMNVFLQNYELLKLWTVIADCTWKVTSIYNKMWMVYSLVVRARGLEYGGREFKSQSLHLKPETELREERGLSGCRKGLNTVPLAQVFLSLKPAKTTTTTK